MNDIAQFIRKGLNFAADGKYRDIYDEAIARIKADTGDAAAYFVLGKISADHNNHAKARELFSKAVELAPSNVYCQVYLAQILTLGGEQVAAKQHADIAASLAHDADHHIADTIGVIYTRTGFHELAIPWFKSAVQSRPDLHNYQYNLGASLQFIGEFTQAEAAFRQVLHIEPNHYRALSSLVQLKKQTNDNQIIPELTATFAQMSEDADARLHLGHAIAKSLEDLGDYRESLSWLHKAKKLKLQQASLVNYQEIVQAIQGLPLNHTETDGGEAPIFIVGLPRTGTTLVDRILGSHSEVVSAGELNLFAGLVKQASGSCSNLTLDVDTLVDTAKLNATEMLRLGDQYIKLCEPLRRGAKRFTDKMPLNFLYCGLIHQALPNARIVVLRRNPMDSCLSNYRQLLTTQQAYYAYTFSLEATAQFYGLFNDLIAHWERVLPSNRFLQIRYEDIVFDQRNQTERLLKFCDLEWKEACLNFHQNEAPVSTASSVQVRKPLYSGSIGRWQRYAGALDELEQILRDKGIDVLEGLPKRS